MLLRWWSLGVWALAAASAAYWGLRLFAAPAPVPAHARVSEPTPPPSGDLTRLFGVDAPPPQAAPAEPPPDARFQLVGVLSPKSSAAAREGVALIAVDGKPPRAYRVGHVVEGVHVLKSVNARGASLGPRDGAAAVSLNLPGLPPAATGNLPPANAPSAGAPLPPPAPAMPVPPQPQMQPQVQPQVQPHGPTAVPRQPTRPRRTFDADGRPTAAQGQNSSPTE